MTIANTTLIAAIHADSLHVDSSLERIASSLEKSKWNDRVCINHNAHALVVKVQNVFWHYVSIVFSWIFPGISVFYPKEFKETNKVTIDTLRTLVGADRLKLISSRYHIDIEGKYKRGDSLTKRTLETIICGIGDIRKDDLDNLFSEIKNQTTPIRHLSQRSSSEIREYFQKHSSMETIGKEGVDLLYEILVPVSKVKTLFLNRVPVITGWMLRDARCRVFMTETMRRHNWSVEKHPQIDCITLFMKRLLNHDNPERLVLPSHNGYYYLSETVIKAGGHCLFYKTVTAPKPENDYCSIPCILSTRAYILDWQKTLSFVGMFENNLGSSAAKALYQYVYDRVNDPKFNFIRTKGEILHISGFSQGGTQVERLLSTDALFNRFKKAYIISDPGIEEANFKHYKRLTDQLQVNDFSKPELHYVTHFKDHVFDIEEGHIGIDVNPNKVKVFLHEINNKKLSEKEKEQHDLYRPASPDSLWIFLTLRDSLKKHHSTVRLFDTDTKPEEFTHRIFTNQISVENKVIQKILNMGRDLLRKHIEEKWRKFSAWGHYRDYEMFRKQAALKHPAQFYV